MFGYLGTLFDIFCDEKTTMHTLIAHIPYASIKGPKDLLTRSSLLINLLFCIWACWALWKAPVLFPFLALLSGYFIIMTVLSWFKVRHQYHQYHHAVQMDDFVMRYFEGETEVWSINHDDIKNIRFPTTKKRWLSAITTTDRLQIETNDAHYELPSGTFHPYEMDEIESHLTRVTKKNKALNQAHKKNLTSQTTLFQSLGLNALRNALFFLPISLGMCVMASILDIGSIASLYASAAVYILGLAIYFLIPWLPKKYKGIKKSDFKLFCPQEVCLSSSHLVCLQNDQTQWNEPLKNVLCVDSPQLNQPRLLDGSTTPIHVHLQNGKQHVIAHGVFSKQAVAQLNHNIQNHHD